MDPLGCSSRDANSVPTQEADACERIAPTLRRLPEDAGPIDFRPPERLDLDLVLSYLPGAEREAIDRRLGPCLRLGGITGLTAEAGDVDKAHHQRTLFAAKLDLLVTGACGTWHVVRDILGTHDLRLAKDRTALDQVGYLMQSLHVLAERVAAARQAKAISLHAAPRLEAVLVDGILGLWPVRLARHMESPLASVPACTLVLDGSAAPSAHAHLLREQRLRRSATAASQAFRLRHAPDFQLDPIATRDLMEDRKSVV